MADGLSGPPARHRWSATVAYCVFRTSRPVDATDRCQLERDLRASPLQLRTRATVDVAIAAQTMFSVNTPAAIMPSASRSLSCISSPLHLESSTQAPAGMCGGPPRNAEGPRHPRGRSARPSLPAASVFCLVAGQRSLPTRPSRVLPPLRARPCARGPPRSGS
jgi:hypothetical protein